MLLGTVVMFAIDRKFTRAKYFLFVGLIDFTSRLAVNSLKTLFGRERPLNFLEAKHAGHSFWGVGGTSFPSGHVGRYFGIFLPLMVIFPKSRLILLVIPLYISAGRIILNLHYASDVLASVYIVIVLTFIFAHLLKIGGQAEHPVAADSGPTT